MNKIFLFSLFFFPIVTSAGIFLDKEGKEDPQGLPLSFWIKEINSCRTGNSQLTKQVNGKTITINSKDFIHFRENASKKLIKWELQKRLKKMLYFTPRMKGYRKIIPPLIQEAKFAYEDKDPLFHELVEFTFFDPDLAPPSNNLPFSYFPQVKEKILWGKKTNTPETKISFFVDKFKNRKNIHNAKKQILACGKNALPELKKALQTSQQRQQLKIIELIFAIYPRDKDAVKYIESEILPKGINEETLPYLTMLPDLKYLENALNFPKWNQQSNSDNAYQAIRNAVTVHKEKALPIITKHILNQEIPFMSTKKAASGQFYQFNKESLPFLLKILKSNDKEIHFSAYYGLRCLGKKAEPALPELVKIMKTKKNKFPMLNLILDIQNSPEKSIDFLINNNFSQNGKGLTLLLTLLEKINHIPAKARPILLEQFANNTYLNKRILKIAEKDPEFAKKFIPLIENKVTPISTEFYNLVKKSIEPSMALHSKHASLKEYILWYLRVSQNYEKTLSLFNTVLIYGMRTNYLADVFVLGAQINKNADKTYEDFLRYKEQLLKQLYPQRRPGGKQFLERYIAKMLTFENNLSKKNRRDLLINGLKSGYTAQLHPQNYPLLIQLTYNKDGNIRKEALIRFFKETPDWDAFNNKTLDIYIDFLAKNLKTNRNQNDRIKAINKLSEISDIEARKKTIPILINSLDDPMDYVAYAAQKALEKQGSLAIPELLNLLKGDNNYLGITACQIIANMSIFGKDAVPALTDAVKNHKNLGVQLAAIEALANIGPPAKTSMPILKTAITGKNKDLRIPAARALIMLGGIPKGDPVLAEIINSNIVPENSKDRLRFENLIMQGIK